MALIASALRLLLTQPRWLAEHADTYARLAGTQAGRAAQLLRQQAWWLVLAVLAGLVGTLLAGVALLLWGMAGTSALAQPWLLVVTPALPLLFAGVCAALAHNRGEKVRQAWAPLERQWACDRTTLRATQPPPPLPAWVTLCAVLAGTWLQAHKRPPDPPGVSPSGR